MRINWGFLDNLEWNLRIMGQLIQSLNVVEQNENSIPEIVIGRRIGLNRSDTKGTRVESYLISKHNQQGQLKHQSETKKINAERHLLEKKRIQDNQSIKATIQILEACLTTDTSKQGWGASHLINSTQQEILFHGNWTDNWRLTSSNQQETAAILIEKRCSQLYLQQSNVRALKVQTESSTTAYNINRNAADLLQRKLTNRILDESKILQLQVSAIHISGKTNTVADSLSMFISSEDYKIDQDFLENALFQLLMHHSINMFANRKNRKCRRFVKIKPELRAENHDGLAISWQGELPFLHSPIPIIPSVHLKAKIGENLS
ncbi:MAG: hypothetical protein EZS28_028113 [Streblomastix strix]|uniref:Reverse transcriptase RNase H-like domain-containing protein n=1 Tax=Streblomastix strix TaxID=222440 RepID=A0A5J4V0V8_9EUKA|nr:MAG: hypothetical protein EZS28_028113 [Streblomastix strix]